MGAQGMKATLKGVLDLTCMDDAVHVGVHDREDELNGKALHDDTGNKLVVFMKPAVEGLQGFSHGLENETDMLPVGALVLEVVQKVVDAVMAGRSRGGIPKVLQNFQLKDILFSSRIVVGFRDQTLHGSVRGLVIRAKRI